MLTAILCTIIIALFSATGVESSIIRRPHKIYPNPSQSNGDYMDGLKINTEWGPPRRVTLKGYTYNNSQAMEPFISKNGKWLFWNSRNEGTNTSLQWGLFSNDTQVQYIGEVGGQANGPVPHLDAVPSMDKNMNFFWVSTRDYPQNIQNLQTGIFDSDAGSIPVASHVQGTFYNNNPSCCWITMDQEVNEDSSLLFYVNAFFPFPPGPTPEFSNISVAIPNGDGTWSEHPRAQEMLASVNNVVSPRQLRYAPSSLGTDALELYFTVRVFDSVISQIFVAKRKTKDDVFGDPELIPMQAGGFIEPEAPTLSQDGNVMMFSRMDCVGKSGCQYINLYRMDRTNRN